METKKCCICGCEFVGWGNNPYPFPGEECCDDCNVTKVIPARIEKMMAGNKEK